MWHIFCTKCIHFVLFSFDKALWLDSVNIAIRLAQPLYILQLSFLVMCAYVHAVQVLEVTFHVSTFVYIWMPFSDY